MEERQITVNIDKAKEWYNGKNTTLKEIALQAFSEHELINNFKNITTFKKACKALGLDYDIAIFNARAISTTSKASSAMFKLNIVRKALNLGYDLHLAKSPKDSYLYHPYNPFITENSIHYKNNLDLGKMEIIGKIKSEGRSYNVLGGDAAEGTYAGLGDFCSDSAGRAVAAIGFLGCASEEIAQHFGKYFGMLITEAKYGDIVDFKIIEDKYGNDI